MNIVRKQISELNPAPYNPRKDIQSGDDEYEKLKRSLQEFGYVEPIIWNAKTGHVVGGHQRLKILRELGETEVDCVVVEMSETQEKALNIALNKITNNWDDEKLDALLKDLQNEDIDLTLTGFDLGEIDKLLADEPEEEGGYFGDERERTYDFYRLYEYDESRTAGYYQFPTLKACHYVPDDLIGFNYVKSWKGSRKGLGVHFYLDDYQFERMWTNPFENIDRLRDFSCVLTPGFSTYRDMPMAMKIWNMYRMRLIGQVMQDAGLQVIPTLGWVEEETHKFCFDGIEPGGVYAVGTVGIVEDPIACDLWFLGMDEAIKRLNPECVICYGTEIRYDFGNVPVKKIKPSGRFQKNDT